MEKKDYDLSNRLILKRLKSLPVNSEEYKQAQMDLVILNHPLIIKFLNNKVVSENDKEDAVQVCRMSLLKAAETYNLNGDTKYSTYAMTSMMFDFAKFSKDYDSNPSGYYTASKILYKAKKRLENQGIDNPSIEQISKEMKADVPTVSSIMKMRGVISTETPISINGEEDGITLMDALAAEDNVLEETIKLENAEQVRKALTFLGKDERYIIEGRAFNSLKNEEICDVLGISRQTLITKIKVAQEELKSILTTTWKFNAHSLRQDLAKSYFTYLQENKQVPNIEELIKHKFITYEKLYDVFKLNKTSYIAEVMPNCFHKGVSVNIKASDVVKNVNPLASKALINKFILTNNMKEFAQNNNVTDFMVNKTIHETLSNFKKTNDTIFENEFKNEPRR